MKKKNTFSVQSVGGASLLTILAVLALVTFALLSMATVKSQQGMSKASAQAVENYYKADTEAQEWLADLRKTNKNGTYENSFVISPRQTLEVKAVIDNDTYDILRWQAVSMANSGEDGTLDVWTGE